MLVGLRDDNGVLNARIGEQHGFDFGGVDVFATGFDEVFGPAAKIDGAVRTTPKQVAHTKPSVAEALRVGRCVVPVAAKQRRTTHGRFADFALTHVIAGLVDQPQSTQ